MVAVAGCDGDQGRGDGTTGSDRSGGGGLLGLGGGDDALVPSLHEPGQGALTAEGTTADEIAVSTTGALFSSAPLAVLAGAGHEAQAASAGIVLGVPVLADGPGSARELERLGTEVVLAVGPVADPGVDVVAPASDEELAELLGAGSPVPVPAQEVAQRLAELDPASPQLLVVEGGWPADGAATTSAPGGLSEDSAATSGQTTPGPATETATSATTPAPLTADRDDLPPTERAEPLAGVAVLTTGAPEQLPALATARAAGAQVVSGPHTDPRADATTVQALAQAEPATVVGLGDGYGDDEALAWKVRTAATGVELPGGGQLVLPGKTYVALYGTPSTSALGVLGEQPAEETVARAEEHASWYADLVEGPVVPTLEIIATVASGEAGPDGNYSTELPVEELEPLVDLAQERGQYVVLDLQPGRTDFLTQAKLYEPLLTRAHVGLALDPEWRLKPGQVHLAQIGSVDVEEVNEVADWLAELTREHDLPQKAFVVHMFRGTMVSEVDALDQSHEELATLIHVDGQGAQPDKQGTWRTLHEMAPSMSQWGWKNFYDEDVPMLTAAETVAQVLPPPAFISYQ